MKLTMEMEMPPENMARLLTWLAAGPDGDVQRADDHQDREHDQDGDDDDAGGGVAAVKSAGTIWRAESFGGEHGVSVPTPFSAYSMDRRDLVNIRGLLVRVQRLLPRQGDEWNRVGDAINRLPS